jgi:hypothetical protein
VKYLPLQVATSIWPQEASFACVPHQIFASLALSKLPISHVVGVASQEALEGIVSI